MSRFSEKQYTRHALIAMSLYIAFMLLAWPLVRTTTSLPFKVFLSLVAVVPMLYVVALMFRRIRESDELEQRMHLVALSVATAVVGVLSLIGGFLNAAGVLKLDGTVLIWVFPILMLSYGLSRWWVGRRYGVEASCDEDSIVPRYVWLLLGGGIAIATAWFARHSLDDLRQGVLWGLGVGMFVGGLLNGVLRWRRGRQAHD
jgi:hypothetical protein